MASDIAAPVGTLVRAAADGILFHAGPDASYGNEALIDHGYGLTTKYGHLRNLTVAVGQEVCRGQIIGTVGMTGRTRDPIYITKSCRWHPGESGKLPA